MLLVKSIESGETTSEDTQVIVKPISWHIPLKKGYWTLSGPYVEYWEEDEDEEKKHEDEGTDEEEDEDDRAAFLKSSSPRTQT